MSVCSIHQDSFYPCNCYECLSVVLFCEHRVSRIHYCPACESDKRLSAECVHNVLWSECFQCSRCCVCDTLGARCINCAPGSKRCEGAS